ncbi:hypothetical protein GCM10010840_31140 [Deinococcus aerolatus]|uniref:Uncharacterized protein n=1 Tax=Deinococcus aerolatus TaxID=522487 RepID=A0ABQ2GE53_9DEIO|nr:hypothetical protein [Deinococcus aerolatus]GGL90870.1 hypothetical protein GCM10010840_31140 [Deinococcus aerolatus]
MNALIPLLPALHTLEPLGLSSTAVGSWSAYANPEQAARLARYLEAEFRALAGAYADSVDHAYLRSEAFRANVVQAVRAAEVAESEAKLRFIARALAGCLLNFPPPALDKFQTLRIIGELSDRETHVFVGLFDLLDPIEPFEDRIPAGTTATVAGLSRQEFAAALLGLGQLGLLAREDGGWKLTALGRQVATLCRIGGEID